MTWIDLPLVLRTGWTLMHFLWQGAVLAGALALILWSIKGRSPRLRYGLACAVLLAMAVAPVATWYRLGQPQAASRVILESSDQVARASRRATPTESASPMEGAATTSRTWGGFLPMSVGLWLIGVAIMSLRLASGWAWLQWLRRRPDTVPASDDIQLRLLRLCQRMNLVSNIRILLCEKVPGPTVMGWLRPVLLLPPAALLGMPADQLELVLAHELAHILRHDFAINLIQSCVEVLLFYHPAVWWVSAKIRQERELCCDDLAVRTTGDALDYAAALTRLEALCRPPDPPRHAAQALALSATGGSFMHRIRRLISPITPTPLAPRAGLVLLLLLGGFLTLQARNAFGPDPMSSVTAKPVQDADSNLGNRFVNGQLPPEGTMWLRRYDRDSADGKRRAGTIYVHVNRLTAAEITDGLTRLDQAPQDEAKGYVELEVKADLSKQGLEARAELAKQNRDWLYVYLFLGADPARVKRVVHAWNTFHFLGQWPEDKKPGQIIIQRNSQFTAEIGVLSRGLNVQVWAGDVPVETVFEALKELMAMTPDAGVPQEVRRRVPLGSGLKNHVSLDLSGKNPDELWKELEAAIQRGQH
ncbi:MAG: M56 family metallopeptidase [Geothrix sp.]|uniref:M56 family metallopeptidase n=1 Tax=Geothrix sp. TaxID=1962974 RepID=UPI0018175B07|nr:M56 family metallopeptidase [Geothrix sp.]NWJ40343.1 M56 family metallopeptidase [Geothrix sp.]WIL21651.1 MAG: M56 family metallopeptidase [Geothrix sp.]